MTLDVFKVYGPYRKNEHKVSLPCTGYVIEVVLNERSFFTCAISNEKDEKALANIIDKSLSPILEEVYSKIFTSYNNLDKIPCNSIMLQKEGEDTYGFAISVHQILDKNPLEIIKQVLMTTLVISQEKQGDKTYRITQFPRGIEEPFQAFRVQRTDSNIGRTIQIKNTDKAMELLRGFLLAEDEEMRSLDAQSYAQEALYYSEKKEWDSAFYSFYYTLKFREQFDTEFFLSLGMTIGSAMLASCEYDYADWIFNQVAELGEVESKFEKSAGAMRLAGISASMMGKIDDVRRYFKKAVDYLESASNLDLNIAIQVHMSYGLAIVEQYANWEIESLNLTQEKFETGKEKRDAKTRLKNLQEDIKTARTHLEKARSLIDNENDEASRNNLYAINLDLLRLQDLEGDSEGACQKLKEDYLSRDLVDSVKLLCTALLYHAYCLVKLKDNGFIKHDVYINNLEVHIHLVETLKGAPGDRVCCLLALFGDAVLQVGRIDESLKAYVLGFSIQDLRMNESIRVPHPDLKFAGLAAIDFSSRIQTVHLLLSQIEGNSTSIWNALCNADEMKGKYFRRNLSMSDYAVDTDIESLLRYKYQACKELLLSNEEDHRIIMAEYQHFLNYDLNSEASKILKKRTAYEKILEPEEVAAWLNSYSFKTAYLSFYVARFETYIYIVKNSENPNSLFSIEAYVLPVTLGSLEELVINLNVGIHGNSLYPSLSPDRPFERDPFFKPIDELKKLFEGFIPQLAEVEHIIVSPHGIWHSIPIHALILPALWKLGKCPGISYSPSINIFEILKNRAEAKVNMSRSTIGLATVRAVENDETEFLEAHFKLLSILANTHRGVKELYGENALTEEVLEMLNSLGVVHILAHGVYEVEGSLIKSRLHLASRFGLPTYERVRKNIYPKEEVLTGDAIMIAGTSAEHVTLQACSLGRSKAAFGDELWGMTRALLAGGADSVLLPMWDIDITSSTELISQFYENWLIHGKPKWKALSEAQLYVANNKEKPCWSHFYHWAALQLVGC